jgi:lipopolysaccharide/colanic/teichoic acid biosynthesis glycosyltransferase
VLKGEMSLVGPRPEMVEYHRAYSKKIPYYNYRLKLKPGIAGWAQINYRHTTTLEEYKRKTEYDLYYIKNRSTILDLKIILQTIEAVFWKRGAK